MGRIVYDVAVSLDGFIAGPQNAVDGFLMEGPHATDYSERLKSYQTVIMGRATYEFGYQYGMKPGDRAYPHMKHFIYSSTIPFSSNEQVEVVREKTRDHVSRLRSETDSEIYLCGGGKFAGFLLENNLVDKVVVKLNPVVFGNGVKLFETNFNPRKLKLVSQKCYENGVQLLTYEVGK